MKLQNLFVRLGIILLVLGLTYSCQKDNLNSPDILIDQSELFASDIDLQSRITSQSGGGSSSICGTVHTTPIFAGQNIEVGRLSVSNDEDNLYVTYEVDAPWFIKGTHLYVGHCEEIPQTKSGNPKIGHFPYGDDDISPLSGTYTETIPLTDLGACYCVVAHAEVVKKDGRGRVIQKETAFGFGDTEFRGNRWGWYFEYCTRECDNGGGSDECETAFAFGDLCFLDDVEHNFNRWGWRIGPLDVETLWNTLEFDIYAGVGQCDISKGTLVGKLTISYDQRSDQLIVKYIMNSPYTLDKTHLYVGDDLYPRNANDDYTVAPGLYGLQHDLSNATNDCYYVDNINGEVYVIAHADACGF